MTADVSVRHRVLGMTLAQCRHDRGFSTRQAALRLGMSPASLNRSENARRRFEPVEVGAALAAYRVAGTVQTQVSALADGPQPSGWWEMTSTSPSHELAVRLVERDARSVIEYSATEIPLVAQVSSHTRALHWNRPVDTHAALIRAARRREILLEPTQPQRTLDP